MTYASAFVSELAIVSSCLLLAHATFPLLLHSVPPTVSAQAIVSALAIVSAPASVFALPIVSAPAIVSPVAVVSAPAIVSATANVCF